jgi:hypothetical protein
LVAIVFVLPARADAHRLDELLQAARVSVQPDSVRLELDLTPGVDVADGIIRAIDRNGDGRVDTGEADAYATVVVRALTLSVDAHLVALQLSRRVFPSREDLRQGIGTIRLVASAPLPPAPGRRRLTFANGYLPQISVYLVNALVPSDRRIAIVGQHRDALQRTYSLDYDVAAPHAWIAWSGAALGTIGFLLIGRRRIWRSRFAPQG